MYRKNLFGDVTAIYNGTTKVAEYVYDAWGNCTITTNVNGYGTRNPIRYRGYYYDTDLNLYYLMTRYYDPQTGRFINADTPEYLDPKTINGLNLYSYCNNNPVMNVDPSGHEPLSASVALMLMTGCFALIFTAMYFIAKNTPPSEPKDPDDVFDLGDYTDYETFEPKKIDFMVFTGDQFKLIAWDMLVYKSYLYFDQLKRYSFYTSLINVEIFAGADWRQSPDGNNSFKAGVFAEANLADVGLEGRYLGVSLTIFGAGIGLGFEDGKFKGKLDLPIVPVGLGLSFNYSQLITDIGGLFR